MLNNVVVVGRILQDFEVDENGKGILSIKVPRPFKNADGIYEEDIIDCEISGMVATNVKEYCNVSDIVGIKGRLEKLSSDATLKVVAEKVTFLSSKKETSD